MHLLSILLLDQFQFVTMDMNVELLSWFIIKSTTKILQLDINLQAVAVTIQLNKTYTVSSLYLPHVDTHKRDLEHLLDQLHAPFLLLCDINAKSVTRGADSVDNRRRIFEDLLLERSLSLLNEDTPTHLHSQTILSLLLIYCLNKVAVLE